MTGLKSKQLRDYATRQIPALGEMAQATGRAWTETPNRRRLPGVLPIGYLTETKW
jgi:hypothetical protein